MTYRSAWMPLKGTWLKPPQIIAGQALPVRTPSDPGVIGFKNSPHFPCVKGLASLSPLAGCERDLVTLANPLSVHCVRSAGSWHAPQQCPRTIVHRFSQGGILGNPC